MLNSKECGRKKKDKSRSYVVIGCGHFGSRAVFALLRKDPDSTIIVVDKSPKAIRKVAHLRVETVVGDGLGYLKRVFRAKAVPPKAGQEAGCHPVDYVIPAVPFHLAFEFILSQLRPSGAERRKTPRLLELPNPVMGKNGDLYSSIADFLCPQDCPEPARYCTVTGKRRGKPLYEILTNLRGPFESKVIRSEQLGAGVGGFHLKALLLLIEDLKSKRDCGRAFLISTACRCHGVTTCLSF
jgi:hypothetical protein